MVRKITVKHQRSIVRNLISQLVHEDDYVLFEAKKFWESLKGIMFYADESDIVEFADRVIFIRAKNSVIKNEILLKKDEIKGLINVYLQDKLGRNRYPVQRIIVK